MNQKQIMLYNIVTSLLLIVITKKICELFIPIKMDNVYLTIGIYGLKAYTYTYIVLQKISTLFEFTCTDNTILITLIKDGNEVSSVVVIPQGSKVKDLIKLKKLEKQNLEIHDLERELSDGDIIDFEKGF